ncbi:MAG: coxG2 [Frankiales bacterium]|nr:coxG2 [Frankiales bacterium]
MQLEHTFTVPVDIDQAWKVLLDIERIAPCMPGAALDTVEGDDFTGSVKVRLGPIGLTYKGKASWVEKDEATHRVVLDAQGKDSRGNGTAAAKVTASLIAESANTTSVNVLTDLNITGKPAQFGRGVMVDVGNKLIGQFADCLAGKLGADEEPEAAPSLAAVPDASSDGVAASAEGASVTAGPAAAQSPATVPSPTVSKPRVVTPPAEVEPIDLLGSAGPAVAKRLLPLLAVPLGIVIFVLVRRLRRR